MDNSAKLFVVVASHKHKNLSIRDEGSWQNPQLSPHNPLVLLMMTLKGTYYANFQFYVFILGFHLSSFA